MGQLKVVVALGALIVVGGCAPGQPAVSANERVAAEDRTEAAPAEGEAGAAAGGGGEVITFVGGADISWVETPEQVPAGPVTVELVCEGGLIHNVVIEGVNGGEPIVECDAGAGSYTGEAELDPGTYGFHCDIPGHEQLMSGELTAA